MTEGMLMSARYARSEQQLEQARRVVPLGAQTFSKSVTQFPFGVSPYFAEKAKGSRLWDIDGNEYLDFINALAAVGLGYCDPDVDAAVVAQAQKGSIYSLSHALEAEVAELICELVPSAEMVRFGKNGSDATAGAVRVARAFTGRDHVIACGYHGWQDWYIGATSRNRGVPKAVSDLTHVVPYNDLEALRHTLQEFEGKVAAIIMEPMNHTFPKPGYLQGVRDAATQAGTVLIFDETITGFRFALGGAQEFFGVTPDLTTLGKALANGYPLAAVCGRRDMMMEMEEIFFSFTMGGETVSLAAAKATLKKMIAEPVIQTLKSHGDRLIDGLGGLLTKHKADFLSLSGHPSWSFVTFADKPQANSWEIKTLWLQEMFERGVLSLGTHNLSYAHTEQDIDRLLATYDEVLPRLVWAVNNNAVRQCLRCEPLKPLFKVR